MYEDKLEKVINDSWEFLRPELEDHHRTAFLRGYQCGKDNLLKEQEEEDPEEEKPEPVSDLVKYREELDQIKEELEKLKKEHRQTVNYDKRKQSQISRAIMAVQEAGYFLQNVSGHVINFSFHKTSEIMSIKCNSNNWYFLTQSGDWSTSNLVSTYYGLVSLLNTHKNQQIKNP